VAYEAAPAPIPHRIRLRPRSCRDIAQHTFPNIAQVGYIAAHSRRGVVFYRRSRDERHNPIRYRTRTGAAWASVSSRSALRPISLRLRSAMGPLKMANALSGELSVGRPGEWLGAGSLPLRHRRHARSVIHLHAGIVQRGSTSHGGVGGYLRLSWLPEGCS
jgi:hypothetical protein